MKVISHFFVFLSLVTTLQVNAQGAPIDVIQMKITGKVGHTYLGTARDGSSLAVVCTNSWGGWTADLVFSVKQPGSEVPELTLEQYKGSRISSYSSRRSPYITLSEKAAETICSEKAEGYVLAKDGHEMKISRLVGVRGSEDEKRKLEASSELN